MKLEDYIDVLSGYAIKANSFNKNKDGIPVIRNRDVIRGYSETYTTQKIDSKFEIKKEDILVAMDGNFHVAKWQSDIAYLNQRVCKVSSKNEKILSNAFLCYLLPKELKIIEDNTPYVTVKHLSAKAINNIDFDLPDPITQKQIVTVLDKAQSLIKKREQSLELLDELLRATFLDMFGDPVLNEKNLKFTKLSELGVWKSGGTPSRSIDAYFKGNIPWFSSGELNDMYISKSKEKITEVAVKKTSAKLIESGSLLVGMYDTAALKSSITKIVASCNQAIAFAKLNEKKCTSTFVYFAIQIGRKYHLSKRRGVRQRNLNLAMIKALEIPLPKLKQQEIFSSIVSKIELQKELIQKSLDDLNNLFQSLLQNAFSGNLKLQDNKVELQTALKDVNWFTEQVGEITNNTATQKLFATLNTISKTPSAFDTIFKLQETLSTNNAPGLEVIRKFYNSLGGNSIPNFKNADVLSAYKIFQANPFIKQITDNKPFKIKSLEQSIEEQKNKELEGELYQEQDPILQFINQEQFGKYSIENYKVNIPKTIHKYFGKREFDVDDIIQILEENKALSGLKKNTIKKELFSIFSQFIKVKYDGLFAFKQMREEMQRSLFNPAFTLLQEFIDQGLKNKSIDQVYLLSSVGDDIRGNDKRLYLLLKQSKHEN
ncbi:hypothetical protein GCM10022393_40970 [Aquimarina addita]|uniref:Type I restriction modification DNA specificity domain-containing protein n=1 Tax=Aquimarina addita TaxID=870485 RepID=A0ABP6UW59_9FLAO